MVTTRHFIFGYGSLVCSQSRKITAPTLSSGPMQAYPVLVDKLCRSWTARITHSHTYDIPTSTHREELGHIIYGQTAMGVEIKSGFNCTGVLIEVTLDELYQFDMRERGYDRVEIDLHDIYNIYKDDDTTNNGGCTSNDKMEHIVLKQAYQNRRRNASNTKMTNTNTINFDQGFKGEESRGTKVWVYLQRNVMNADQRYPIMQSYVDIIVRGCLGIGDDFTKQFLKSTHGFGYDNMEHYSGKRQSISSSSSSTSSSNNEYIWLDDRVAPFYVRADKFWSLKMKHIVDKYLKLCHPKSFRRRLNLDDLIKK